MWLPQCILQDGGPAWLRLVGSITVQRPSESLKLSTSQTTRKSEDPEALAGLLRSLLSEESVGPQDGRGPVHAPAREARALVEIRITVPATASWWDAAWSEDLLADRMGCAEKQHSTIQTMS